MVCNCEKREILQVKRGERLQVVKGEERIELAYRKGYEDACFILLSDWTKTPCRYFSTNFYRKLRDWMVSFSKNPSKVHPPKPTCEDVAEFKRLAKKPLSNYV